ncbi:MAG: L-threonylcarbamoyladenylate synthase [Phycisphaerales bacterium]
MIADPRDITIAAAHIRAGGLVAFPTETVYGLGADALSPTAIAKVYQAKGRPSATPLIIHVSNIDMAQSLTSGWNEYAQKLALAFWPGPLTMVLPKASCVPDIATSGAPNVAVRMPNHPTALALITAFGGPLVGPSANPSGRISPTCAEHVRSNFNPAHVSVLDGGPCERGIESTVISLVGTPRILRQGIIGAAEIGQVLGTDVLVETRRETDPHAKLESPGTSMMHYAPFKPAYLVSANSLVKFLETKHDVTVIAISDVPARSDRTIIRMPADDKRYAATIYGALHDADSDPSKVIVIEEPPKSGELWLAVHDRLSRATVRPL